MSHSKIFILMIVAALMLGTFGTVLAQGATLVVWADNTRAPIISELSAQVEADLGITLEVVETGFGDIRDQLLVAGPVGEGPDVLIGAHDWLGQLVVNGAVAPIELSEDLLAEFSPDAISAFTYEGQLYGLPYGVENIALIRNTDLVPEAPTTWQEVQAISEELVASGESEYGFLIHNNDFYHVYPIITAFGGYVFGINEDGSYNPAEIGLATPGGQAAAEWMGAMYSAALSPTNAHNDEAFALFEEGQLAMFITGPWFIERLNETGINFSIDPLPGAEGGLDVGVPFSGVQGFMISAFSENQLLAEIFLTEYVATTDFMQAMFDRDPRGPAFAGVDTSDFPEIASFAAAGMTTYPMPAIPEMSAVWSAAGNATTLISQGDDPVATYENAQDQIVEAIGLLNSDERIVGLPGSLQDEAGCDGDWNPACEATFLVGGEDGIYTLTLELPAGDYEFKIAMNGAWEENYGVDGEADGANYTLSLEVDSTVTFTYDDNTNLVEVSVE